MAADIPREIVSAARKLTAGDAEQIATKRDLRPHRLQSLAERGVSPFQQDIRDPKLGADPRLAGQKAEPKAKTGGVILKNVMMFRPSEKPFIKAEFPPCTRSQATVAKAEQGCFQLAQIPAGIVVIYAEITFVIGHQEQHTLQDGF